MDKQKSFIDYIETSVKKNWDRDALTDYQGITLQYNDVARKIEKLHIMFDRAGVHQGDKIAMCGRNSANWAVAFLATLTYGAVAVPILHEFKTEQIHHIVNHSDAKILFVGDQVWPTLSADAMPVLEGVINIPDYALLLSRTDLLTQAREHLNELFGKKYPKNFRQNHVNYVRKDEDELALINYTSGSTGFSKGVMIPYRALWSNMEFGNEMLGHILSEKSKILSMLPMAHMYGMAFEFLYEFVSGCHIFYLTRAPSPKIIFKAFSEIRPHLVVSVPLIIEKIIKKSVLPKLDTRAMRMMLRTPILSQKVRNRICEQMREAFGGRYYEIIVGGAAFNREIERFLHEIGFNFTVGYGATECAPIICYADWKDFKPGTCGKAVPRMEVKIDSNDPYNVVGEILCRGTNVMLGYYKNEEATKEAIDESGWWHTGDLGLLDPEGNVYIKGRSKNMLLGASGQNIYPEEVEDALNNMPLVNESVVVQKDEKLYALIYPDVEEIEKSKIIPEELLENMEANRKQINEIMPKYLQIAGIKLFDHEFEKTPKRSIKRFLYSAKDLD